MNPSHEPAFPAEFIDLTDKRLAGIITPAEQGRLEWHLENTPGAVAHYLALAATEALLPDALALANKPVVAAKPAAAAVISFRRRLPLWGAAAAVLIAVGFSARYYAGAGDGAGVPARVSRSVGARWIQGAVRPGDRPVSDTGVFDAGFVELTMDSGVRVVLEGPASYKVTGANSLKLAYGKAVADVPPNAKGFTLDAPGERIIDHGTRFAIDASRDGARTTVGVLSGEIEVKHGASDIRLYTDYALRRTGETLDSVPFERRLFTTEMPAREFDWKLVGVPRDKPVVLRFDVSRLVHGAGDYRAVFKWLTGRDSLAIDRVQLRCDDRVVADAEPHGATGLVRITRDNAPLLRIAPGDFTPGKWELVAEVTVPGEGMSRDVPVTSAGIVTLEEGLSVTATAADFVGRWKYSHDGKAYVREFGADGRMRMTIDGKSYPDCAYSVKDGVLTVVPAGLSYGELHTIRDDGTLVFLNLPYRNAHKQ